MSGRRAFVIVLDACGIGALPDAGEYGDAGANTLAHLAEAVGGLRLPTLERLGLGSIIELAGVAPAQEPVLHGRLRAQGPGKDSTAGHWELMGVVGESAPPTYPGGVPADLLARIETAIGASPICNAAYNGIDAIDHYGDEHLRTGRPILYTSQDSVLQLAAHVDVIAPAQLYAQCAAVRAQMTGPDAVGRVIARPFAGAPGAFERTAGRRDFALAPPSRSHLQQLQGAGLAVHAVGKVKDLFAGVGIDVAHAGASNPAAIAATSALLESLDDGFVFTNLVETDQVYGHRKDIFGFEAALRGIDAAVARWLRALRPGDLLVLTADHGCDPLAAGTDHTREFAPLLAVFEGSHGRHDGALSDVGASVLAWLGPRPHQAASPELPGEPFV
jgi:phosphopentomutase